MPDVFLVARRWPTGGRRLDVVGDTGDDVHLLDERLDMLGTDNDDEVFAVDEVVGLLPDDKVARLVRVHRYRGLHAIGDDDAALVAPVEVLGGFLDGRFGEF